MKVSKWVDMGQEVEVEIGADDIRIALAEAFERVESPQFEEVPTRYDVVRCLSMIGTFLNALTAEQIELLSPEARKTVGEFLLKASERFPVSDGVLRG